MMALTRKMKWRKFWRWVAPAEFVVDLRLIHFRYRAHYRPYFYKCCGHAVGALLLANRKGHFRSQDPA